MCAGVTQAMADVPVLAPAADAAAPAGKSKKTLIIVIVLAVVLLAGGGVGAWFAFMPHDKKPKVAKAEPPAPALYVALDPPFVVNFEADQQVRFLQVTAQLMSRDPATIELLKTNDPVVRNDLLMLFGGQKYATVSTREGKEALRTQTLAAVRKIVAGAGGKPDKVEAVYFTSFVMQ
jgi:flagellar FliL protein